MATPTDVARVLLARAVELRYDEPAPSGVDRSEGIEWAAEAIAWARGIVEPEPQPPAETDSASSDTN